MSVVIPKSLLPELSENLRREFTEKGILKHVEAGEVILKENALIKHLPIVISGTLKVMREDSSGREILLYFIKPGESCIMSLFGGLYHEKSKIKAMAEESSELLLLPAESIQNWITSYPEWTEFMLLLYHKRFEEILETVNEIAFQKIDERILKLLHKKADLNHTSDIHTTHQQLADELGTSREVVSRLLKQLEKEQKIRLSRNKITLTL
jgi:CRP/FNR family transcriptional regulator, anaerobic regulatory protein